MNETVDNSVVEAQEDDFDPREYLMNDTSIEGIADKLVNEFKLAEGPRKKRGQYKDVRHFWSKNDATWKGQLSLTRTYVGDERNQTWSVDWYPFSNGQVDYRGHIHTGGLQHRLLDFMEAFRRALAQPELTNRQAIRQAAQETGYETRYIDHPVGESMEDDFDPREYLLSAPADYVVKWSFGPPEPGRHLYRYTRINGATSEAAALREWQAKMEKDWGWCVGDERKPHLVKVIRAVIQDRPVQEAEDDFDPREYLLSEPTTFKSIKDRWDVGTASKLDLGVEAAKLVFNDAEWQAWADKWLAGERSAERARLQATRFTTFPSRAAEAAYYASLACSHQLNHESSSRYAAYALRCVALVLGVNESVGEDDFDAREYFTHMASVPEMLKSLRYELTNVDAAKVLCRAGKPDIMLLVTMRGGQPLSTGIATSAYDLGIYKGAGRDWNIIKYLYAFTPESLQQGLEEAEKAIMANEWGPANEALEPAPEDDFDAREYFLDRDEEGVLEELGFKQTRIEPKREWERIAGSVKIQVCDYGYPLNDAWFVLGFVNDSPLSPDWVKKEIEGYYPEEDRTLQSVIDEVDALCRGVYEAMEEPAPEDDFDPRQYFIDASAVSFKAEGKPMSWNFGTETSKDLELYNRIVTVRLRYHPDERKPLWKLEAQAVLPWRGSFGAVIAKLNCGSERMLQKRMQQFMAKVESWWEKIKWGVKLYPLASKLMDDYGSQWRAFADQNKGSMPTAYDKQTEETAVAWERLMREFLAGDPANVAESDALDDFDPRDYATIDRGQMVVDRLKALGYRNVQLHVKTPRHATLTMNDPEPGVGEHAPLDVEDKPYVPHRNTVKGIVTDLMGLATNVYDFSGQGGSDYMFKIADPEHMGIQGRFEAEDTFDPREYLLGGGPNLEGRWRAVWSSNEGTVFRSKGFDSPEKALRYVYTASLWNKAVTVALERTTGEGQDFTIQEYPVTDDYELIDPDTGNVLIREALVFESEAQDFSARDYLLSPEMNPAGDLAQMLDDIGFNRTGANTWVLRHGDDKFVVQARNDGKYRYSIYDLDGHKVRGQIVNRQPLIDMLGQHLNTKLREAEDDFDPREYLLSTNTDDMVLGYLKHEGFRDGEYPGGVTPRFYTVWVKDIDPYSIHVFRGQPDDRIGSSRWWLEIWESGKNTSPGMGAYFSAENFLPRLKRQVELRTRWAQPVEQP